MCLLADTTTIKSDNNKGLIKINDRTVVALAFASNRKKEKQDTQPHTL